MIIQHDVREPWPVDGASVDMIFTSPPFWRQRCYGDDPRELGLEATLEEWVQNQVAVFREAKRALRSWGTLWIELGDKRSSKGGGGARGQSYTRRNGMDSAVRGQVHGYKRGDLVGAPAALARALRDDGWYHRAEIIWHKPDASPETTYGWHWERHKIRTSEAWEPCPGCEKCEGNEGLILRRGAWRPTLAHTVIYLFSVSESYYIDQYAMLEPVTGGAHSRGLGLNRKAKAGVGRHNPSWSAAMARSQVNKRNGRSVWSVCKGRLSGADYGVPYDHFASFPVELPMLAIRGATSERGNCPACGKPWCRVVERDRLLDGLPTSGMFGGEARSHVAQGVGNWRRRTAWKSLSWRPSCQYPTSGEAVPAVVLDPYCGSGTTALAAETLGRKWIGFELYEEHVRLAERRLEVELRQIRELRGETALSREMPTITGPLFEEAP